MKAEKIIKLANGYLMLFIVLILFFGGIAMSIIKETPVFIIVSILGFIGFFGFILVNPNTSKVILLFGKYVGTITENGLYWANPLFRKKTISLRSFCLDQECLSNSQTYPNLRTQQNYMYCHIF